MADVAKYLMSSVTRHVARNVRPLSTSRPVMVTYQVQTEEEFHNKVMNSSKPVVVDFCATWCHLCKEFQPRLEAAIIQNAENKVDLAKVDIHDLTDLALEHGVRSAPTVIAVKNGQILDSRLIGLQDEGVLASFINKLRD